MQSSENDYVDVGTIARAYHKSEETVRRWCRDKAIKGAVRVGRDWIIPRKYASGHEPIILPDKGGKRD